MIKITCIVCGIEVECLLNSRIALRRICTQCYVNETCKIQREWLESHGIPYLIVEKGDLSKDG